MLAGQQSQIWSSSEPNTMVGADYNLYHWSNAYLPLRGKLFKKNKRLWSKEMGQKLFDSIRPYVEMNMEKIVASDVSW